MRQEKNKENKKKGFFARFIEKLDKKMEEKAKKGSCCCGSGKKDDPCCS